MIGKTTNDSYRLRFFFFFFCIFQRKETRENEGDNESETRY